MGNIDDSSSTKEAFLVAQKLLLRPDEVLLPSDSLHLRLSNLTKRIFADLQQKRSCPFSSNRPLLLNKRRRLQSGPIPLHLNNLHPDQIWEQIDRIMKPELDQLTKAVLKQTENGDFDLTLSSQSNDSQEDCGSDKSNINREEAPNDLNENKSEEFDSEGEVDIDEQKKTKKQRKKLNPIDDKFFKMNEMEKFVKEGEKTRELNDDEDDEDDEDDDEDDEDDEDDGEDEERALELLLDEFDEDSKPNKKNKLNDDGENDEDNESNNKENEEMREGLKENDGDDNDDCNNKENEEMREGLKENNSDDNDESGEDDVLTVDGTVEAKEAKISSLIELSAKERRLNDAIDEMEMDLIGTKHWSLMGEAGAKSREHNSLLSLHLELPQYNHQKANDLEAFPDTLGAVIGHSDDVDNAIKDLKGSEIVSQISNYIEQLVKQRIRDVLFDDVERKYEVPLSEKPHPADDDPLSVLDFKKSRIGLADVYAEQYQVEILGGKVKAVTELDKKKVAMTQLFAKIMYKLDSLCNQRILSKPVKYSNGMPENVAAITVEDTIPVIISEAQRVAPEEMFAAGHEKQKNEMTQEERKALRNATKERRRKKIVGKVTSGEMTVRDMVSRSIHLQEKNKQAKRDRKSKKATGLTTHQLNRSSSSFSKGKRYKGNELLAQAIIDDRRKSIT